VLLRCREFEFRFPRPALVMGIVNVTPDSFSDGGRFLDPARAVEHALKLVADGAEMLDIGGESTRPGAAQVPELEELRRVMPVLKALAGRVSVPISIDTMKPGVARAALDAGVSVINDVGANRRDPEMRRLAAESGAGYVCVHMQGTPQTMQHNPVYQNVVREVGEFFSDHLEQLSNCGIPLEQIILDPGIGFGKTFAHNVQLIGGVRELGRLARPLLLGVSRKGFLGRLPGADAVGRLPGALACACLAVAAGARLIRVHDVAETVQAVRLTEAVMAEQRQ
jgi:dihydropteroate synthase